MSTRKKSASDKTKLPISQPGVSPSSILHFFAGNPMVEVMSGNISLHCVTNKELPGNRTPMQIIKSVPSYLSIGEFISFAGSFTKKMKHVRIIRDNSSNGYILLVLFNEQKDADAFYLEYDNKSYSSMSDDEICNVSFVKKVEFIHPKNATVFPPTGQPELPTCSICLEKLDSSVSSILTILCNHSFHCDCLTGWRDENRCPICRYSQTPAGEQSSCSECGIESGLWVCLVCGHVGCTRSGHSEEHYNVSQHTYSLELDTHRVWDHARKSYVHRLVANHLDGKMVEIPDVAWEIDVANTLKQTDLGLGKQDAMELEWQYLLEAHLETQQRFFEERIGHLEKHNHSKIKNLEEEFAKLLEEKEETKKKMESISKEKKVLERKSKDLEKKIAEILEETNFLKDINHAMENDQQAWQHKIHETEEKLNQNYYPEKDEKIKELEDQVKNLMQVIETQSELTYQPEVQEGQILIGQTTTPEKSVAQENKGNNTKKGGKKRRKK